MKCEKGCLARDTMVLMADGSSKRIDEICIGDVVRGHNGVLSKVEEITTGSEDQMIQIELSNGKILRLTRYHQVL